MHEEENVCGPVNELALNSQRELRGLRAVQPVRAEAGGNRANSAAEGQATRGLAGEEAGARRHWPW